MLSSTAGFVSMVAASACLLPLGSKPAGARSGSRSKHRCGRLSCKASADDDAKRLEVDRRRVLLGLGGVAAATTTNNLGLALAQGADASQCAAVPITAEVLQCVSVPGGFRCPGLYSPGDVVDFGSLPRLRGPPRVRKAAHLLDEADVKRYEEALGRMKALPDDDPRSFKRQSAIHEAYCASHYKVVPVGGGPETVFDVHYSSIFAPWHRMYIYFFEGILGDLVGDPTFGLPYWNWDTPAGMVMPAIFDNKCSPLYNSRRNPTRVHGFIDLNLGQPKPNKLHSKAQPKCTDDELICRMEDNLAILYRQMAVSTPKEFYGGKFCSAELDDKGKQQHKVTGSLEAGAHTAAHIWLGDPDQANQDMGDLSTAARDPVFYSNHSNVDRMWHVWSTKLGGPFLPYQEWLDTSFVFYDGEKRPVRTKVSDVLDIRKLGYTYEEHGDLPWLGKRPKPATGIDRRPGKRSANKVTSSYTTVTLRNDENVYMTVARPEMARAGGGSSKKAPEALVVDITLDPCEYVKFDVLVNVPKGQEYKVGPRNAEFAGSFTHVPHGRSFGGGMAMIQVSYQFALRELLEDLKSGDDGQLDITIVPVNADEVVIDDARIELL